MTRQEALEKARALASQRAVDAGASVSTLDVVGEEDIPLSYIPGNSLRVRVRMVGEIG